MDMMNLAKMYKPTTLFFFLLLEYIPITIAQQLSTELHSKFSPSDQKKIQKAEELYSKGEQIENDISQASKEDRKVQLKRLEAADFYQRSNALKNKVYTDNAKDFWKKYTGEKKHLDFARKIEISAEDSFKMADEIRKKVEKESKLPERIQLLEKAEHIEKKALIKMQKVLYTYLSWPAQYDQSWFASDDISAPVVAKVAKKDTLATKKDGVVVKKDTVSPKKDVIVTEKDTVKQKITLPEEGPSFTTSTAPPKGPIQKMEPAVSVPAIKKTEELTGNDSSLYGLVKVDEDRIDQFNDFLKNKYPSDVENYVINFKELDYSDIDKLREAWYKYQFGNTSAGDSTKQLASGEETKPDTTRQELAQVVSGRTGTLPAVKTNGQSDRKSKEQKTPDPEITAISAKDTIPAKAQTETGMAVPRNNNVTAISSAKHPNGNEKSVPAVKIDTVGMAVKDVTTGIWIPAKVASANKVRQGEISQSQRGVSSADFVFRVQIVACRVPLDAKTLRGIYNGTLEILELLEEDWYKYAVGEYSTYRAARRFVEQSKIPGAFVIAYLNGKRIKITPAIAFKKSYNPDISRLNPELIRFRVQIAASEVKLLDKYIQNIYNGSEHIDIIREEGWYKYSLMAGKTFEEAKNLLARINVPGAFIVAYHQDTKIDLPIAIRLTK
jgi:hypothetical protein